MKSRTIAGTVLALAGIGAYAVGAMVLMSAIDTGRAQDEVAKRSEIACREQLVKFGRVSPKDGNVLEVDFGEIKGDPRRFLGDITAALAMCPGRVLQEACVGVGCASSSGSPGAVRMTARLSGLRR